MTFPVGQFPTETNRSPTAKDLPLAWRGHVDRNSFLSRYMSALEPLRVRKQPLEVELALEDRPPRRMKLFLAEHDSHTFQRQRVLDLLQAETFLPACDAESGEWETFNSRAVLWIGMPLSSVDGEEAADELFEHRQRVHIDLIGGTSLVGELLYSATQEGPRIVDLLNRKERFLRLWTEDRIVLVNKKMLLRVVEESHPMEQPWRRSISS